MAQKVLNITNGDAFNDYYLSKLGGDAVPFCEAMMDGDTVLEIYSEEFIKLRAFELGVSVEKYRSKAYLIAPSLNISEYEGLNLWFGKDTFCQMNLLMLLSYLEQISYGGEVALNYIDDETFDVLEADMKVELGIYERLYRDIFILKKRSGELGVLVPRSIELYFDYHSENGKLACAVRENLQADSSALIRFLIKISPEYGLSDVQAQKLIEKYKEK